MVSTANLSALNVCSYIVYVTEHETFLFGLTLACDACAKFIMIDGEEFKNSEPDMYIKYQKLHMNSVLLQDWWLIQQRLYLTLKKMMFQMSPCIFSVLPDLEIELRN